MGIIVDPFGIDYQGVLKSSNLFCWGYIRRGFALSRFYTLLVLEKLQSSGRIGRVRFSTLRIDRRRELGNCTKYRLSREPPVPLRFLKRRSRESDRVHFAKVAGTLPSRNSIN